MTFTKEQLIERARENVKSLKFASTQHAFEKAFPAIEIDIRLAEIALASLEAEPDYMRYDCGCCGWETIEDWRENDVCPKCNHHPMGKTPLYAAPPAPVSMKDHQIRELVNELRDIAVEYHGTQQLRERIARTVRAAMLQGAAGNSPAIPDGCCIMPKKLTAENGAKGALSGEFSENKFINCPECFGDDECETCDGSGRIEISVPVSWTTIKEIWAKGVEHFAAAPQQEANP